jgi:two-component system chemotaxis sensor kinase CheA
MSDTRQDGNPESAENIVKELRVTFREEAYELLAELESSLLELEKNPDDQEQVGRVFRALHTIKGSGGACEFHNIVTFTHEVETVFDKIRSGKIKVTNEIIDLALQSRDQIKSMLNAYYLGNAVSVERSASILESFRKFSGTPAERQKPVAAQQKTDGPEETPSNAKTYRIRFRPRAVVFTQATNPVNLLNELREFGKCTIMAQTEDIPSLEDYDDAQTNYTYWDVILTTNRGMNAVQDVFLFVKDTAEVKIKIIDDEVSQDEEGSPQFLGDILIDRGDLTPADMQKALNAKKRLGELLIETGVVPNSRVEAALVEQQHVRDLRERRQGSDATSSIRVATGKLDSLVNLVGELVTVQARLAQTASSRGMHEFISIAEEVERLTALLRDNTMNIRMLPIGTSFSKLKRLVRDLSSELGKEIELVTDGAETELDKTVIERMGDPLVHIIRNCIDHGIELPAIRTATGKPRQGTIQLSAMHSGAHVLIQVKDDGAGMDVEMIRAKAVDKGLIQATAEMTDRELRELILLPGFSTAKEVTGVSGRGVGMDVVKSAINALRGTLDIASTKGRGTTITLKLPLTLAIIDGFLTRIGAEHFIFPMWLVEECVALSPEDVSKTRARRLAHVRGEIVPYIRLRDFFGLNGEAGNFEQIVIVNVDNKRVGLVVDSVVGEHQTVLKSLGMLYRDVKGISGATVLGDGTIALVLDVPRLVETVESEEMIK